MRIAHIRISRIQFCHRENQVCCLLTEKIIKMELFGRLGSKIGRLIFENLETGKLEAVQMNGPNKKSQQ